MRTISNSDWEETIMLLLAYSETAHDRNDLREVNKRRRARCIAGKLLRKKEMRTNYSSILTD